MSADRLYGPPGAEVLDADPLDAADDVGWSEAGPPDEIVIEEWTIAEPGKPFPSTGYVTELVVGLEGPLSDGRQARRRSGDPLGRRRTAMYPRKD